MLKLFKKVKLGLERKYSAWIPQEKKVLRGPICVKKDTKFPNFLGDALYKFYVDGVRLGF